MRTNGQHDSYELMNVIPKALDDFTVARESAAAIDQKELVRKPIRENIDRAKTRLIACLNNFPFFFFFTEEHALTSAMYLRAGCSERGEIELRRISIQILITVSEKNIPLRNKYLTCQIFNVPLSRIFKYCFAQIPPDGNIVGIIVEIMLVEICVPFEEREKERDRIDNRITLFVPNTLCYDDSQ